MLNEKLLKSLCVVNGISGKEEKVRDVILKEIKPYATSYNIDNLGNIIVFKQGQKRSKNKLMLSAHMDEVGLIVTNITEDGYINFSTVGGIDKRVLPGKSVVIGKGSVSGVIGVKPIHLSTSAEKNSIQDIDNMYIDIGADTKKEAEKHIKIGDQIAFLSSFEIYENRVKAKALDDRIGCYILINMIKKDLPYDMYFTFVTQEEVGLRGAKVAAYTVNPDFAIVLEATTALDLTDIPDNKKVCKLDEGCVVSFMDRSTIYDKELYNLALEIGKNTDNKIQVKQAVAGGNDSGAINVSKSGVRTLAISLPCRYLHTPTSMISVEDIYSAENITNQLAIEICKNL